VYTAWVPQAEYLQYGGQAIIEGVMMRSPRYFAIACRAPNGAIVLQTEALEKTWIGRQKWLKLPFLRGTFALLDAMALGIRAMRFSSHVQLDEVHQKPLEAGQVAPKTPSKSVQNLAIAGAMVAGLAIGILVFNVLPNALSQWLGGRVSDLAKNYLSEIIKMIAFFGYIWGISRMPEIREVFRYHGAEHKAINTLEAGQALESENCQIQTRLHPRCGTSFAVIVLLVGFLLFPLVPRNPFGLDNQVLVVLTRVAMELLILPIVAGISYEALRFAGKFRNQRWVMAAFRPGLWMQLITTQEPNDAQVDVALAALKAVVKAEQTGELATDLTQIEIVELDREVLEGVGAPTATA